MDRLPQEIVDLISSHLTRDDLKTTLLVSPKFRYAAERCSGAFSDFTLAPDNASQFLATYTAHRLRYLQIVTFPTSFPAPRPDDEELNVCRDSETDLKLIDEDFTRQIRFLFSTIEDLEARTQDRRRLIDLIIYSPARDDAPSSKYCLHHTFTSWRVRLLSPTVLPSLTSIRSVTLEAPDQSFYHPDGPCLALRKIDLRVLVDLAQNFPNLNSIQCKLGGDEWSMSFNNEAFSRITQDWPGPRRDSRHALGEALEQGILSNMLSKLRHASLDFLHPLDSVKCLDQRLPLPNLTKPLLYDPLSSGLRLLSTQLRTMRLCLVADSTLFWPADGNTPTWPNLERLNVMFHMSTPSGSWYFQGPPSLGATEGYDIPEDAYPPLFDTDEDIDDDDDTRYLDWQLDELVVAFRVVPNEATLTPFLTAFAKAVGQMHSLKEAALWCPLKYYVDHITEGPSLAIETTAALGIRSNYNSSWTWGVAYTAPGEEVFSTIPSSQSPEVYKMWWSVAGWRPDNELHNLFRQIGGGKHGGNLEEYWDDGMMEERIFDRCWFD